MAGTFHMNEKLTYESEAGFLIYFVVKKKKKKKIKIQTVDYSFSFFFPVEGGRHSRIGDNQAVDLRYIRTYPELLCPKWVPIT